MAPCPKTQTWDGVVTYTPYTRGGGDLLECSSFITVITQKQQTNNIINMFTRGA
jgi:hypothetical protein